MMNENAGLEIDGIENAGLEFDGMAMRLLSELHWEFDRSLHVAYVDLKSAFDSVDRQALWKALMGIGMPQVLLKLIEDLHTGTTSRVRLGGLMSDSFSTSSGVRQGCILAPALFCRAFDWKTSWAFAKNLDTADRQRNTGQLETDVAERRWTWTSWGVVATDLSCLRVMMMNFFYERKFCIHLA